MSEKKMTSKEAQDELGKLTTDMILSTSGLVKMTNDYSMYMPKLHMVLDAIIAQDEVVQAESDCKAGCWFCCNIPVHVTEPGIKIILLYLKMTYSKKEMEALKKKLKEYRKQTRGVSLEDRANTRRPCVFLDQKKGQCKIYAVRPLNCRTAHSRDVNACKASLEDPKVKVPWFPDLKDLSDDMFAGISLATGKDKAYILDDEIAKRLKV